MQLVTVARHFVVGVVIGGVVVGVVGFVADVLVVSVWFVDDFAGIVVSGIVFVEQF